MYAGNTHVTYESDNARDIQTNLNTKLENIHNWLTANKLNLNMTKTDFMLIGSRRRLSNLTASPKFAVNDFPVTKVSTAKSLGVIIDDNLDWGSHIENIIQKVSYGIGAMKQVRHLIPQATVHLIYRSLVLPHFNYCITVRGNCRITLRNKLQNYEIGQPVL